MSKRRRLGGMRLQYHLRRVYDPAVFVGAAVYAPVFRLYLQLFLAAGYLWLQRCYPTDYEGCGVDYFLTTKIQWNDTNAFPYDTFYWQGIDGTKVFTHFNKTHIWPDAEGIYHHTVESEEGDVVRQKHVSNMRLLSYGFGDGGGGPQFEMIEAAAAAVTQMAARARSMCGGGFMQKLEQSAHTPATYSGELYLELHVVR